MERQRTTIFTFYLLILPVPFALAAAFLISVKLKGHGLLGHELFRLFDLNGEANIPAWFSASLWLYAAYRAYKLFNLTRTFKAMHGEHVYWLALSIGSVLLSIDEISSIHEMLGSFADHLAGDPEGFAPVYRWVWIGLACVITAAIALARLLFMLPLKTSLSLIAAGAIFLSGAMGVETLGSLVEAGSIWRFPLGLTWNRAFVLEETLEMLGAIAFAYAMHDYQKRTYG